MLNYSCLTIKKVDVAD